MTPHKLADLLDDFPGEANRTSLSFMHILNMVAKFVIKQFDVPKAQATAVLNDEGKEFVSSCKLSDYIIF